MSSSFTVDELIKDRWKRLSCMYKIVDKDGKQITYQPNWAQIELYQNIWYRNVILKARQLGCTTAISLFFLDDCLFTSDLKAGIIAHTEEDVRKIFRRVKYAYDNLPESFKKIIYPIRDSQTELSLSNGSSLRVGLSMRGDTLQRLLVSEYGKICAKYPEKAREIRTGAIEAVPKNGICFIESTAEGREGHFHDLCIEAQDAAKSKIKLTTLDYQFHFFPWYKEPDYKIDEAVYIPVETEKYFDVLEKSGIILGPSQKVWYTKKKAALGEDMMREYPTTPAEAFEASQEGLIFGPQLMIARAQNRISHVPLDRSQLVYTAWDLGYSDHTAIWFFQICGQEIHFIDYYQDQGKSLQEYIELIRNKPYQYAKHFAPHDIEAHELQTGLTRREFARRLGIDFDVIRRTPDIQLSIDLARTHFNRCWFDVEKCKAGIKCLDNYRKKWVSTGFWAREPFHDENSHGASSLMYAIEGLDFVKNTGFTADQRKQIDFARKTRYM
jgi:hypothetical protein